MISFYTRYVDTDSKPLDSDLWNILPPPLQNTNKVYTLSTIDNATLEMYPSTSGKNVYRKEFLEDHQIRFPSYMYFEDDIFFLHTIFAGARIGTLKDILYAKRLHPKQITRNRSKYFSSTVRLPIIIDARLMPLSQSPERVKALIQRYVKWATISFLQFPESEKAENLIYLKELLAWVESMNDKDFLSNEKSLLLKTIHKHTPNFKPPFPLYEDI